MIWLVIVTKPIDWLGGGVGARKQSYIEKRRLSFMYFIVDKMIILLSARFMIGWPYIYRCDWFPKWFRLYFCKICITLLAKVALWIAKKGHKNRKWLVSSIPLLQRHISEGVSMKLWHFLWYLKGLRPTLNWSRYRSPNGSCMPKIFFFFGRIKDKMWYLRATFCKSGALPDVGSSKFLHFQIFYLFWWKNDPCKRIFPEIQKFGHSVSRNFWPH